MKIVLAPDSFKECAAAAEVAAAMAEGAKRAVANAEIVLLPMADGGEGTVEALVVATNGKTVTERVTGPLGESLQAVYGVTGDGVAVIETAAASGLHLVHKQRRDPRITTSRGTGELLRRAIEAGARQVIVGLGGSATNDGGAGLAQALGYSLLDAEGRELVSGGTALCRLASIDRSGVIKELQACTIRVACDVQNPLTGPQGASKVYGPQKGATLAMAEELDAALQHYGEIVARDLGVDVLTLPGAGAAGGLGAGLVAFAGATLEPGIDIVAEAVHIEKHLEGADLVFTGEGRIDGQTVHGKTPVGVARLAERHGVPVVVIAGSLGDGYEAVYNHGIAAAFSLCPGPLSIEEAIERWRELMVAATESAVRAFLAGRSRC